MIRSRGFRKFCRSKLAIASACVIFAYVALAAAVMFLELIPKERTEERVGPKQLPGFGMTQDLDKRFDDADFHVTVFARALQRPNPRKALDEIRLGERRASGRPIEEIEALVAEANEKLDELGEVEELALHPELEPKMEAVEAVVDELYAPLEGWASGKQALLVSLGTDVQGRSIAARGFYAVKVSIQIGVVVGLLAVLFGSLLGAAAAFFGSWVDGLVQWLYSTLSAVPYLVLLSVLVFMFSGTETEQTLIPLYTAFSLTFWIGPCRVTRGEALRIRELDYVHAATALGQGRGRILLKHIIPNVSHLMFVNFSLLFIGAIKSEVILTFLGLGVKNEPSWGVMINQSRQEVVNGFFWQIGAATALMFFLVLAFNIFTDALQDALDPKHIA